MGTAMDKPHPSPLLRLPPELRNKVYHETLGSADIFHLEEGHMEHPILSVNHQLRRECMGIFYANTRFQFVDPIVCIRRLSTLTEEYMDLIPELRYDTSETCIKTDSWRSAFRELPGLDEDTKLDNLREELLKVGIRLRTGVLKARIVIACCPSWTGDPLGAALSAIKAGTFVDIFG